MEPVACTIVTNPVNNSKITFEVCTLEQTEIPFETCLIVPTDKFAPVNGYSIVDQSKSVCLFTHTGKVYHNNIPKDDFVPLLIPLGECKMFQIELSVGTEFKFGVTGNIYSCLVTESDSAKMFIDGQISENDIFEQLACLHKKIPHRIPQRPQIQRCKSMPCVCENLPTHIKDVLVKSASRESLFDNIRGPFAPPISPHTEYDVDRIFIRSFDPITKNVVWKLRDINANRLLIKFSSKATTYKSSPFIFNVLVFVCKRNGETHTQTYLAPEALKLGVTIDIKDVANIKIIHAGQDIEPRSVAIVS
jgi:hypothetical protein